MEGLDFDSPDKHLICPSGRFLAVKPALTSS
jgi:hypothetical protein